MDTAELARRIKDTAYLEGDFVLRSGQRSKYYLDKYLFEAQPDILAELGRRLAERIGDADLIAGPEVAVLGGSRQVRHAQRVVVGAVEPESQEQHPCLVLNLNRNTTIFTA